MAGRPANGPEPPNAGPGHVDAFGAEQLTLELERASSVIAQLNDTVSAEHLAHFYKHV